MKVFMLFLLLMSGFFLFGQEALVVDNGKFFPSYESRFDSLPSAYVALADLKTSIWSETFKRDANLSANRFSPYLGLHQMQILNDKASTIKVASMILENQGALSLAELGAGTKVEGKINSTWREQALSYRSKVIKKQAIHSWDMTEAQQNRMKFMEELKDSLRAGRNFVLSFKRYDDFKDLKNGGIYIHPYQYAWNAPYKEHSVCVYGYRDSINAEGYNDGAFKVFNSSYGISYFDLSYYWFYGDYVIAAYFLEEDFTQKPQPVLYLEISNTMEKDDYKKYPFFISRHREADSGEYLDFKDELDFLLYRNLVHLRKKGSEILEPDNRFIMSSGDVDGTLNTIASLSDVFPDGLKYFEVIVYSPKRISVIYNTSRTFSYTRDVEPNIDKVYLSLGENKKIIPVIKTLTDTSIVQEYFFSRQLNYCVSFPGQDFNSTIRINKSTTTVARKVLRFYLEDIKVDAAPEMTASFDKVNVFKDSLFNYQFMASDPEGKDLFYQLLRGDSASLSQDGLFSFKSSDAGIDDVGKYYDFQLEVSDGINSFVHPFQIFVYKFGNPNAIHEFSKNKISVYPNPFKDKLNFVLESSENYFDVKIYNLTSGQLVGEFRREVIGTELSEDLSFLKKGLYILRLDAKKQKPILLKVIKE